MTDAPSQSEDHSSLQEPGVPTVFEQPQCPAVTPQSFVGRRLLGVTSSWYVQNGERWPSPGHVWLRIEGLGHVMLNASGDGIRATLDEPYDGYEMAELGAVVEIETTTPERLVTLVGETITDVLRLRHEKYDIDVGFVLVTGNASVAIVDFGDEMTIGVWPDGNLWSAVHVEAWS